MTTFTPARRATFGTAIAALLVSSLSAGYPAAALAQAPTAVRPTNDVTVSVSSGRMIRLPGPISDLFVANDGIADVQVRSADQIYVFGKSAGQTTVFATNKAGKVVYSANVRVGQNFENVDDMLRLAMPEAQIRATTMNGAVLLTGTVASPSDVEQASSLVQAYVGDGVKVFSRLKTATPQQVMLKVRIAEVSRSLMRNVGVNLETADPTGGGFLFGLFRGRDFGGFQPDGSALIARAEGSNTIGGVVRNVLGLDVAAVLDANQNNGLVTTLAEPTLVSLSGETASFLAGGEFPIATSNGISGTSVEFKQYGVSLAFTPFVLEDGRISMRVRPEVSELTSQGAITLNGTEIPALSTRRAETTVELGSGQSFMIAGLLNNSHNNAVEKLPFLGDVPILGALFRSQSFRRSESELVIIVTPYLVKPMNAAQVSLPTDGFRVADEGKRLLLDQAIGGRSGEQRPEPESAAPRTIGPGLSPSAAAVSPSVPEPRPAPVQQAQRAVRPAAASPKPGFSF